MARQNLAGYVPDGALVRLSMIAPASQQSLRTLNLFAAALFAASGKGGRALLAGAV